MREVSCWDGLCVGISGTTLKWLALISMTIDHIGVFFFPGCMELRMIGRAAYPIFAYMVAEGCAHTRRKQRYFLSVLGVGLLCSVVSYIADGNLYQSIFITFACSIALIFGLSYVTQYRQVRRSACLAMFGTAGGLVFLYVLCHASFVPGFVIDYGFCGAVTPVMIWLGTTRTQKLAALTFGLCCISLELGGVQVFSLAALPLLMLYNGRRGTNGRKYIFYLYYPAHLAILYGIVQRLRL